MSHAEPARPSTTGQPPCFTVLLPVHRPPALLPYAMRTVLAQTVASFELFVVCDGAPDETIACARHYAAKDPRVKVFALPKAARTGEAHRHTVLAEATGQYVAHIGDDDLWFPNHLEELEQLLRTRDFGHTLHVAAHCDGSVEALPADLANPELRRRMLNEVFNRFGDPVAGYRLDAYRRLPEGWVPSPAGLPPDLLMWRKFLRRDDMTYGTRMAITALVFWSGYRRHMSLEDRERETSHWYHRLLDADGRKEIVQSAWKSLVVHGLQSDPYRAELVRMTRARDELQAELAAFTQWPGQLQAELARTIRSWEEIQTKLTHASASLARCESERARITQQHAELEVEMGRLLRSRSWRLTKPLRTAAAMSKRVARLLAGSGRS